MNRRQFIGGLFAVVATVAVAPLLRPLPKNVKLGPGRWLIRHVECEGFSIKNTIIDFTNGRGTMTFINPTVYDVVRLSKQDQSFYTRPLGVAHMDGKVGG